MPENVIQPRAPIRVLFQQVTYQIFQIPTEFERSIKRYAIRLDNLIRLLFIIIPSERRVPMGLLEQQDPEGPNIYPEPVCLAQNNLRGHVL